MQKTRLSLALSVVAVAALAACSSSPDADATSPESEVDTAVSAEPSRTPSPSATASAEFDVTAALYDTSGLSQSAAEFSDLYFGVPNAWAINTYNGITASGQDLSDERGAYNTAVVADDSLLLGPTTINYATDLFDRFDQETLERGEAWAASFMIDTLLDNEGTFDNSDETCASYLERTSQYVAEEWRETWMTPYTTDDKGACIALSSADTSPYTLMRNNEITIPDYADDQTRVLITQFDMVEAVASDADDSAIQYKFNVEVVRAADANTADGATTPATLTSTIEQYLVLRPVGDSDFEIVGWQSLWDATPYDPVTGEEIATVPAQES